MSQRPKVVTPPNEKCSSPNSQLKIMLQSHLGPSENETTMTNGTIFNYGLSESTNGNLKEDITDLTPTNAKFLKNEDILSDD